MLLWNWKKSVDKLLCILSWCLIRLFCELFCCVGFVNEALLQHRVHLFILIPSFFISFPASCNLILFCAQAPPPRLLMFPLIHCESPLGVNNYAPVSSSHTVSTGLIQLIKVAVVNPLTHLGPLCIPLLIYSLAYWLWLTVCVFGNLHCMCHSKTYLVGVLHKCTPAVFHCLFLQCVSVMSSWHADVAMVWILSAACCRWILPQRVNSTFTI